MKKLFLVLIVAMNFGGCFHGNQTNAPDEQAPVNKDQTAVNSKTDELVLNYSAKSDVVPTVKIKITNNYGPNIRVAFGVFTENNKFAVNYLYSVLLFQKETPEYFVECGKKDIIILDEKNKCIGKVIGFYFKDKGQYYVQVTPEAGIQADESVGGNF